MLRKYFFILVSLLLFSTADANENESKRGDIAVSAGKKSGNITFQIGGFISDGEFVGKAHFPISELIFPTNFNTAQLSSSFDITHDWELFFKIETNVSSDTGLLEDRDWFAPGQLDIYSESKTDVSAREFSIEFAHDLKPLDLFGFSVLFQNQVGFGVLGQQYDFRGFDTIQSYPGGDLSPIFIEGDVITYKFSQITPYASYIISQELSSYLSIELKAIFSPLLFASDVDHHLKRDKVSKSNTRGWLFNSSVDLLFSVGKSLGLFVQLDYQAYEANGKQTQTVETSSGSEAYQIKVKHLSEQTNFRIGLDFIF